MLFKDCFDVGHFNVFAEFCYNIASVLCFGFLITEACGILMPPGIEPAPCAIEVLTTEPPGKS